MSTWIGKAAKLLLVVVLCAFLVHPSEAEAPPWPTASVVYCIYPTIFSPGHSFTGVTAQLKRLKDLGVTVVWLMPVTPIGHTIPGHGTFDSPYCVHDYFAVNPEYGTDADLRMLITTAHALGLKVILDEVLNHTSWDNALITRHPEYYIHSDGSPKNPASIKQAFNYSDVAQLNYANADLRTYMTRMLRFWLSQYGVDGFRFDSADSPGGSGRMIPADFWQELGRQLRLTNPGILLLGECETPDLALNPFALDYGWRMYEPLKNASYDRDAAQVEAAWRSQVNDFPPGMKHLSVQDDWDYPRDVNTFGGEAGALAVAVFSFTNTGVPLLYNGMEIGNAAGVNNPHAPIYWAGGNPRFVNFYREIIALRRKNPALQEGAMTWLPNSVPAQVLTYTRAGGGSEFLIEINLSSVPALGTIKAAVESGWTEVPLAGMQGVRVHAALPHVSLKPKDFAIFRRSPR